MFKRYFLKTFLVLWIVLVAVGAHAMWRYSSTPGGSGLAPQSWPADAPFQTHQGRGVLVMLAHPHCPCTRASLAELANLMEHVDLDAVVLFVRPEGASPGWEQTSSWKTAAEISGVRVLADSAGFAARLFGAETSGHVLCYDAGGSLRFSGGITAARDHLGPSAGASAILSLAQGGAAGTERTLTFGCPLLEEKSR